jgi:cytochrome P450
VRFVSETQIDNVPLNPGFDHGTDAAMLADLAGEWDRLREQSGAFRSDAHPWNLWYLTRFDDVTAAFRDIERFSSRQTNYNIDDKHRWIPAQVDPPEHTPYRTAINPYFGPSRVAAMEPAVRARCAELIEQVAGDGECDLVTQFARRFPTSIFMEMVGLPLDEADTFLGWASDLLHTAGSNADSLQVRADAARTIYRYLRAMIADRRDTPAEQRGDDIISSILDVEIDGRPITDDELREIAMLLYVAGMDTVAGLISYAFQHLAEHPEHRAMLRDDPLLVPGAVEEFLRYFSIASPARVVRDDTQFAGCPMKAGDRVVLATWPANRDPRQFPDADRFVIDRSANRHCAFGVGIHRCVGSHLARLELRVAIEEWLARIPDFEVAPGAVITQHVAGAAGLDTLPLVWSARP